MLMSLDITPETNISAINVIPAFIKDLKYILNLMLLLMFFTTNTINDAKIPKTMAVDKNSNILMINSFV